MREISRLKRRRESIKNYYFVLELYCSMIAKKIYNSWVLQFLMKHDFCVKMVELLYICHVACPVQMLLHTSNLKQSSKGREMPRWTIHLKWHCYRQKDL